MPRKLKKTILLAIGVLCMLPLPVHLLLNHSFASTLTNLPVTTQQKVQTAIQAYFPLEETPPSVPPSPPLTFYHTDISLFTIHIPAIGLVQNITPNVNPGNQDEYLPVLEQSVAHGKYTALPNVEEGNTYLFAHSRLSYNGITPPGGWFTRIDELEENDIIIIQFNDDTYTYAVRSSTIVESSETTVYTGQSQFNEKRSLTLQTCYPRGTTEKRLLVHAEEV